MVSIDAMPASQAWTEGWLSSTPECFFVFFENCQSAGWLEIWNNGMLECWNADFSNVIFDFWKLGTYQPAGWLEIGLEIRNFSEFSS